MILKGVIFEDFVNYRKPSMVLEFPICKNFKCDKECGERVCQNSLLAQSPNIEIYPISLIKKYLNNPISEAIVCQGLEPFDSWPDLIDFLYCFRQYSQDDFVIYTGYTEKEIQDKVDTLKNFKNVIIKFGRYIPNQPKHFDEVLGVSLASPNQYAKTLN